MVVYVREACRDVNVYIYGIDGDEHTEEFFDKYFENVDGIIKTVTVKNFKKSTGSDAVYIIEKISQYEMLTQQLPNIQKSIDIIAMYKKKGKSILQFYVIEPSYII